MTGLMARLAMMKSMAPAATIRYWLNRVLTGFMAKKMTTGLMVVVIETMVMEAQALTDVSELRL